MRLSLDEIEDWKDFENLVADYFKKVAESEDNSITHVKVHLSGDGSDGGKDMLVILQISDSLVDIERKWVVQCKFLEKSVSKSHLVSVNIPSLIHEHGADGYILICKNRTTTKVTEMFYNLCHNCRFKYKYVIWTGNDLIKKIIGRKDLIKQYFPKYCNFTGISS